VAFFTLKQSTGLFYPDTPGPATKPSPLKTIHWIVLPSSKLEVVLKGYEDGLAALWTDDSVLLSVSDVARALLHKLRWKHP
jgi:hypothetical protein